MSEGPMVLAAVGIALILIAAMWAYIIYASG